MATKGKFRTFILTALKSFAVILLYSFAYYISTFIIMYLSNFTMIKWEQRQLVCLILGCVAALILYFYQSMGESARLTVLQKYDGTLLILSHVAGHLLFVLFALVYKNVPPFETLISYPLSIAFLPIYLTGNLFWGSLIAAAPLLITKIVGLWVGRCRILKEKPYLREYLETERDAFPATTPKGSWRDSLRQDK